MIEAQHHLINQHPLPSNDEDDGRNDHASPSTAPRLGTYLDAYRQRQQQHETEMEMKKQVVVTEKKDSIHDDGDDDEDITEFNLDDLIEPDNDDEEGRQIQCDGVPQSTTFSTTASTTQSSVASSAAEERSLSESSLFNTGGRIIPSSPLSAGGVWTKSQQRRLSRCASDKTAALEAMMHRSMPVIRTGFDDSFTDRSCTSSIGIQYNDDEPRARRHPSLISSSASVASEEYTDDAPRSRRPSIQTQQQQTSSLSKITADRNQSLPNLGGMVIEDPLNTTSQHSLDLSDHSLDMSRHSLDLSNSNRRVYESTPCFDRNAIDSLFGEEKDPTRRRLSDGSIQSTTSGRKIMRAHAGTREILQKAKSDQSVIRMMAAQKTTRITTGTDINHKRQPLLRSQSERLNRGGATIHETACNSSISPMGSHRSSGRQQPNPDKATTKASSCRRNKSSAHYSSTLSTRGRQLPGRSQSDQIMRPAVRLPMGKISEEEGGEFTWSRTTSKPTPRRRAAVTSWTPYRSDNVSCALLPPRNDGRAVRGVNGSGRGVPSPMRTGVPRSSSMGSTKSTNTTNSSNKIVDMKYVHGQRWEDPNGQDGRYTGIISNFTGAPNGEGKLDFANGGYYDGDWFHGVRTGSGKLLNKLNGDLYSGAFLDDQMHGTGAMIYCDGSVFKGKFLSGKLEEGCMIYPNGASYTGAFRDGRRHCCRGTYIYQDGSIYVGNFDNDTISGHGRMTWVDGSTFIGEWKDGKQNGFGKEFNPDGEISHEGLWHDGDIVA